MDADEMLHVLATAADAVLDALAASNQWGPSGLKVGQYRSDLTADAAAIGVLDTAGFAVLSEESGVQWGDRELMCVLDPLDGSTNASRGVPWFATSMCVIDADGPVAALVVNLASGMRFDAIRGGGARCDGGPIHPSGCDEMRSAIVGLSGLPDRHFGWAQFRALGAVALDLCAVAAGVLDGYVDCSRDAHGPWDYMGGLLVCREAGAVVIDAFDRELVVRTHDARRTPVAAATHGLHRELLAARGRFAF